MADTKMAGLSPASSRSSKFTASIISPTTVVLTIHKSRSASALPGLQREVQEYELARGGTDDDSLQRSRSLPSRLGGVQGHRVATRQEALVGFGSCQDGLPPEPGERERGEETARQERPASVVASNSRAPQLDAEIKQTKRTITDLEKTIINMKVYIDTLERQLKDEAQNSELLKEELEESKRLCCKLHEACSRGDMPRSEVNSLHPVDHAASVRRRSVQPRDEQDTDEPSKSPRQSHVTNINNGSTTWNYEDKIKKLDNEIAALQRSCKQKDCHLRLVKQKMSQHVHRDSFLKLEAKRASLETNLHRANRKVRSLEQHQVDSVALLDDMMCKMEELQGAEASLSKENSELKNRAARHADNVSMLKEQLRCSNLERRAIECKIRVLNGLLHNKQGEVTQKETALETKTIILDAITAIAYTSPSHGPPSKDHSDADDVMVEQRASANIGKLCGNRRLSATGYLKDVDGFEGRPSRTCNKSGLTGNTRRVSCYPSDSDSSEADTSASGPRRDGSPGSASYQGASEPATSREENLSADSLRNSELSLGEEDSVNYGVEAEGLLLRKRELENYAMRSRDRCWHYVYVVQDGTELTFYETREHMMRDKTLRGESPVDLIDALVTVAVEYTRRKHVFRVRLDTGKQYLFQARDDREMLYWVSCMDSAARCQTALTNGVPPSIAPVSAPLLGSPSKSDRIKNAIRSSLSTLMK